MSWGALLFIFATPIISIYELEPHIAKMAVDIHVRIPTEPTAAIASLPILPTQASVRSYQTVQAQILTDYPLEVL